MSVRTGNGRAIVRAGHRRDGLPYRARIINRLARLYVMSQERRYMPSLADLARDLGVCTRTVQRDLEGLEFAGVQMRWRRVE